MTILRCAFVLAWGLGMLDVLAQRYDIRVFGVEDGLPGSTVTAITQDSAGYLWVDTDGGLCCFDGRSFEVWNSADSVEHGAGPFHGGHLPSLAHSAPNVRTALIEIEPEPGLIWQANDGGIKVFAEDAPQHVRMWLGREEGLSSDEVIALFKDRSGVIWIGTRQGGLCGFTSDARTYYGLLGGPMAKPTAITHWRERNLILGTGPGGLWFDRGQQIGGSFTKYPGTDLAVIDRDRFCLGSDSGILVLALHEDHGRIDFTVLHSLLTGTPIHDLHSTNDGIWAATSSGVFLITPELNALRVGRDTTEATALCVAGDSILIGTHHGLFAAPADNSAAHWTPVIGAGSDDITHILHDNAGNVFLGTADAGVIRYRNGSTKRWTTREGLASDRIRQLLFDAFQDVWVGTDRGFNRMELDEMQEEVIDIRQYGVEDGFPGIEAMPNACMLGPDSALWFGTTRGTIRFDPRKVLVDPVAPNTRITDLALFFEHPDWSRWCDSVSPDGLPLGLRLPHDRNHLTFTFSGLSLAYPEKVRFQYKLEGRDTEWSPIIKDDNVTFSGLGPGEYTFLVKARNGSGLWNDEPARYSFSITPPFWATTTFRLTGGGLLLLGILGMQRIRERRSRKARERLERIVKERTRELADEKHRSDSLLLNILPETTAAELKERGTAQARGYTECTVLFSDFQGFTVLSGNADAASIVTELDRFFRAFDRITDTYSTEKIKTIGDAYMCASGVPEPSPTHTLDAVLMALEMLSVVEDINALRVSEGLPAWPIRIGLNTGPLIAGVVGEKKFAYDVWGDTVNLASRMESNGAPGRVNVTGSVLRLVEPYVIFEARGPVQIKGKGAIESWFVDRLRPEYTDDPRGRIANPRLMGIRDAMRKA